MLICGRMSKEKLLAHSQTHFDSAQFALQKSAGSGKQLHLYLVAKVLNGEVSRVPAELQPFSSMPRRKQLPCIIKTGLRSQQNSISASR